MNVTIDALKTATPGTAQQLAGYGSTLGLYVAAQTPGDTEGDVLGNTLTRLTAYAPTSAGLPTPGTLSFTTLLPTTPGWALALTADNTGELAVSQFGGGWNTLEVYSITGGQLVAGYSYDVEDTAQPRYVLNTSTSPAKQQYVSAIFSGYQLGLIGLQEQDGQQVPHVAGVVGAEDAPVARGRVFGDLSSGLPATVTVVYQTNKLVGPLAPSSAFCGSLSLASYDINNDTLGTPVALLPGIEVCDFDLAVGPAGLCLLAVTGAGAPLLALFSSTGQALDTPVIPAGSWSNAGHWVTSPSVVSTPGGSGFTIAFVEMQGDDPVGIYTGAVTPSTPAP